MAARRRLPCAELGLHRPRDLRARRRPHLRRQRLALRLPGSGNPQPRRLQAQSTRHARGRRRPRRGWRDQRPGQSLRASQHAGLHRQSRHREGVRLPLSPMDLRPRGQSARRAVPPRLSRPGRHAGRFPPGGTRPAAPRGDAPQRRGVRQLRRAQRNAGDLSRRRACWAISTACSTAANSSCSATCASAFPATGN